MTVKSKGEKEEISEKLEKLSLHPVFLTQSKYNGYYEGYCNSTLWPLCHYFYDTTRYHRSFWDSYRQVNQMFADEVCRIVEPGSKVWVQDYQLMPAPQMIREKRPDLHIAYFLHIPFPSNELFRVLSERDKLLRGLLGADFIGFHTPDYLRHFISAVERNLKITTQLNEIIVESVLYMSIPCLWALTIASFIMQLVSRK